MTPPMTTNTRMALPTVTLNRRPPSPSAPEAPEPDGSSGPYNLRREQLYRFIERYIGEHGIAPTIREMQAGVGYYSTSMVSYDLRHLFEKKRLIKTAPDGSARGFTLAVAVDSSKRVVQLEAVLTELREAIREAAFNGLTIKEARELQRELLAKIDGALVSEVRA